MATKCSLEFLWQEILLLTSLAVFISFATAVLLTKPFNNSICVFKREREREREGQRERERELTLTSTTTGAIGLSVLLANHNSLTFHYKLSALQLWTATRLRMFITSFIG